MMRRLQPFLLTTIALLLLAAGAAQATTLTTTNFNTWKTSLSGAPTELDFTPIQFTNYNTPLGLSLTGMGDSASAFTFTGPDNGSYSMTGTTFNNVTSLQGSPDSGAGMNVAMPTAGENAMLLSVASTTGAPITLTLSDGESFAISGGLFGFSLSHPVYSLSVSTDPGSQVVINDFFYGRSNIAQDPFTPPPAQGPSDPTPEGATIILITGGSLLLFGARRKFGPLVD